MPEGIQKILDQITGVWNGLDTVKKATIGGVLVVIIIAFVAMGSYSSQPAKVLLYENLNAADYAKITKSLDALGYSWSGTGTSAIYVPGDKRQAIITKLAQDSLLPAGIEGWEIFNFSKWDETTFDKNVKLHRAMKGALEQMLMTLDYVKRAKVELAIPKSNVFDRDSEQVSASVMLVLKPGMSKVHPKKIQGIKNLIARSIPRLKRENITITDQEGREFTEPDALDQEARQLDLVERKKRFEEQERRKIMGEIQERLHQFFAADRISVVRVALNVNWDVIKEQQKLVAPVEKTPEDPDTPYPDRELMPDGTLKLSESTRRERFRGNGFTPGGPTGTEQQLPPGYRDLDYQRSEYGNNDIIRNYAFNRIDKDIVRQPWEEKARSISVMLDGRWDRSGFREKEDGSGWEYIRKYVPPAEEELRTLEKVLKASILYKTSRGDQIIVAHMQKDRSAEFQAEDAALSREMMIKRLLIVSGIALAVFLLLFLLYRAIKKEIARRRRLREEELAAQQQLMREAALRVADEGAAEVELSVDEKARREMLENALNLAREKPDQVAKLLRTWLQDEG